MANIRSFTRLSLFLFIKAALASSDVYRRSASVNLARTDSFGNSSQTGRSLLVADAAAGHAGNLTPGSDYLPPKSEEFWRVIYRANRHKWKAQKRHDFSVRKFFESAVFFEWCALALSLPLFVLLHLYLIDLPSSTRYHSLALLIWLGVASVYGSLIWCRLGNDAGVQWLTGYALEFIFSIENVFVFHIVVTAFKTPRFCTQKALFVVIILQILFEMLFYMGLADRLRRMAFLPYILGVWLLYVGVEAARGDESHGTIDIKDNLVYRAFARAFGARLTDTYHERGHIVYYDGKGKQNTLMISLLGPATVCLLIVDFLLEVDVTLTKIEELNNEYIAFSSSVVAAFAVPELFFVARDLFQRFHLLKYGISFVLIFFGVQMLCHDVFTIPDLVGCAIMVTVMLLCVVASWCSSQRPDILSPHSRDVETQELQAAYVHRMRDATAVDNRLPQTEYGSVR